MLTLYIFTGVTLSTACSPLYFWVVAGFQTILESVQKYTVYIYIYTYIYIYIHITMYNIYIYIIQCIYIYIYTSVGKAMYVYICLSMYFLDMGVSQNLYKLKMGEPMIWSLSPVLLLGNHISVDAPVYHPIPVNFHVPWTSINWKLQ